jgi:hypothetical protein
VVEDNSSRNKINLLWTQNIVNKQLFDIRLNNSIINSKHSNINNNTTTNNNNIHNNYANNNSNNDNNNNHNNIN